jgi:hypothetical protein
MKQTYNQVGSSCNNQGAWTHSPSMLWFQSWPYLHEHSSCTIKTHRPHFARLYFISEAVFEGFSSMNNSIDGAKAILVNRLAKQLFY